MLNETIFSLLNIGFNICFMLYLIFKYFYEQNNKYYLFLALLSLSFTTNLILRLEIVNGDYTWIRISRKAVVIFFYAFILSFLDIRRSKFVRISLISGMIFISIGLISRLLISSSVLFSSINSIYRSLYSFVDLYIIAVMISYVWKKRTGYYLYILYGLLTVITCAVLIYTGDQLFGLHRYISGYLLFQTEIIICFCFFFLAIITKESEQKNEIERLEYLVETEKKEKENSLNLERERIAFDMHDELGAGLSAIKLQSEILKKQGSNTLNHDDLDALINIADHMNKSIREMLWSINPQNDNLKNFEEYCIRYGREYFERTPILFKAESNLQDPGSSIYAEVRYNMLLILKEAFHNCAKHSQGSSVNFSIIADSRSIHMIVEDNGIGLSNDRAEGYGLKSMKRRVEKLNGEIRLRSDANGTQIDIKILTDN